MTAPPPPPPPPPSPPSPPSGRRWSFTVPPSIGKVLERMGRVSMVTNPVGTLNDRVTATGRGRNTDVHAGRVDGGDPTAAEVDQGRLAPRHQEPPLWLAVSVAGVGLALVVSWLFLPSPLRVVLFWIGLSLFLVAVVTPLSMRSDAVLTDSTRAAKRIARTGRPAIATVTGVHLRNTRINANQHGSVGDEVCDLDLAVTPQGDTTAYRVRKRLAVDRYQMHRLEVGASFEVRIDPTDPSVVVLP